LATVLCRSFRFEHSSYFLGRSHGLL